jgi:thiosulfate/3-mercaptopyruvate sulfurtransferase
VLVKIRFPTAVLGAIVIAGCGQGPDQRAERDTATDLSRERAPLDLFDTAPATGARLVFVGTDSTKMPRSRADAVFVPLSTFSVEREGIPNEFPRADSMASMLGAAGVGGDRWLIVGEPIPAGRAYAAFDYLGLGDRATLLDGGPAALAPPAAADTLRAERATPGQLAIDVRDDMIVDAKWVHDRLHDPGVAILDARPPNEFTGETPGGGIDRPGHIPGARNVFWQRLVQSAEDPRLRDEAELRRMFEEAGVGPEDTVVAYCRTGGQASFLYTVARHLGYTVRLYDGSYIDWSKTEYPVER